MIILLGALFYFSACVVTLFTIFFLSAPALSIVNLTASLSFSCDFEQPDLCKFSQDTSDDFDWTQQQHGTDTVKTGPENDHTYGTPDGNTEAFLVRVIF